MAARKVEDRGSLTRNSFRLKKTLREFTKPRLHKQPHLSLPLPPLPPHDAAKDTYIYDILYQCQRGSWTVGFSSKTLLQLDPNPWCDVNMRYSPMDIQTYQLPDPTWAWVSKEWAVDMTDDVDEAGWQYAFKFHGAVWHGNYKHFRSFVRRRRWVRLRHHRQPSEESSDEAKVSQNPPKRDRILIRVDSESPTPSSSAVVADANSLVTRLKQCRIDRERLALISDSLKSASTSLARLLSQAQACMMTLDFEASKQTFVKLLFDMLQDTHPDKVLQSSKTPAELLEEAQLIDHLSFYYDVQDLLNKLKGNQ